MIAGKLGKRQRMRYSKQQEKAMAGYSWRGQVLRTVMMRQGKAGREITMMQNDSPVTGNGRNDSGSNNK